MTDTTEWLEMKYIGENRIEAYGRPLNRDNWNWAYTPSGRICVNCRGYEMKGRQCYIFTFFDLVEKVSFITEFLYQNIKCFYFVSETEMVVVTQSMEYSNQFVCKIDYSNQKCDLQDYISHTFTRYSTFHTLFVPQQQHKFVTYNRIDYVFFIGYRHNWKLADGSVVWTYRIYMMPKDSENKNITTKEFLFHLNEEDRANIRTNLNEHELLFNLDEESCVLNGTKLLFSYKLFVDESDIYSYENVFYLVGAYWEVDLTKLIDTSGMKLETEEEVEQLMEKQGCVCQFIELGSLRITNCIELLCYDEDVGIVTVFKNSMQCCDGTSTALVYPSNVNKTPITLDYEIPSEPGHHQFTLHPHGALLHIYANESSLYIRVMNCLKVNLMSMALNRAMFHKNTIIRNHPVYRLCFNKTKPIKYNNMDCKNNLKRKSNNEKEFMN